MTIRTTDKTVSLALAIARDPAIVADAPKGSAKGQPGTFSDALACLPAEVENIGYTPAASLNPLTFVDCGAHLTGPVSEPTMFSLHRMKQHARQWERDFRRMRGDQWRTVTVNGQTFIINVHSRRPVEFRATSPSDEGYRLRIGVFDEEAFKEEVRTSWPGGEQMTLEDLDAEAAAMKATIKDNESKEVERDAGQTDAGTAGASNADAQDVDRDVSEPRFTTARAYSRMRPAQQKQYDLVEVTLYLHGDHIEKLMCEYWARYLAVEELGGNIEPEEVAQKMLQDHLDSLYKRTEGNAPPPVPPAPTLDRLAKVRDLAAHRARKNTDIAG